MQPDSIDDYINSLSKKFVRSVDLPSDITLRVNLVDDLTNSGDSLYNITIYRCAWNLSTKTEFLAGAYDDDIDLVMLQFKKLSYKQILGVKIAPLTFDLDITFSDSLRFKAIPYMYHDSVYWSYTINDSKVVEFTSDGINLLPN